MAIRDSIPSGQENLISSKTSRLSLICIHIPVQWFPEALSAAVEQPGLEADHSHLTSSE